MWRKPRSIVLLGVAVVSAASGLSGCGGMPLSEQAPGPASVWLTSDPATPSSPVEVVMTSPNDPGISFAHIFVAGEALRGDFATSQGTYALAALGGACSLPLVLGPNEAVDVLVTLGPGSGCSLGVVRRGHGDDPALQKPEDAVLITNHNSGAETPFIEPVPSTDGLWSSPATDRSEPVAD
jgi:hypothetical protein